LKNLAFPALTLRSHSEHNLPTLFHAQRGDVLSTPGEISGAECALVEWVKGSGVTGLALVRGGVIVSQNLRARLFATGAGTWRWLDGAHARVRYETLDDLLITEAARLERSGSSTSRFERHSQVVEVRFERLGDSVVAQLHDATQHLRAQMNNQRGREALLHEERMQAMGILASGVAHDLNHALNVIGLRVATLRADPRLASAEQTLESVSRVVSDAAAVVARLQDLARRRRDRPNDPLDLSAVLTGAIEMARTELSEEPVRIEAHVPPLPLVRGSAAELSHVFTNLLLRARDAMPDGGTVRVEGHQQNGAVVVTVSDQGPGIPDDELVHIFDPFHPRAASDRSLSLSIAYGVMSRLGGNISVSNRGGTLFTLTFPLASKVLAVPAREKPRLKQSLDLLLVDDEPDNLDVLREVLELEGHRVDVAGSGRDAISLVKGGARYDLVLCDVGMPEMSGWQVAREIRALAPDLRIFMLTGWAAEIGDGDPRRRLVAGVLSKPLDLRELSRVLDGGGDKQARLREVQ